MLSASNSLTAFDAIWLASPPPPLPTSPFISSAGAVLHRYCYGISAADAEMSPVLRSGNSVKSPITVEDDGDALKLLSSPDFSFASLLSSPVLQLGSDQRLEKTMYFASGRRHENVCDLDDIILPSGSVFRAETGVGLGLGLPLYYDSAPGMQSEATGSNDYVECRSTGEQATTVQPQTRTWGIFDALVSFFDNIYSGSPATPTSAIPSSQSLTAILPHVFASPTLSPMTFWRPTPPTPEPDCPRELRFQGTPIYELVSPQLPVESGKRARCRPSPRPPRFLSSTGVDIKSPVFEYSRSVGTTPYDRHGWNPIESFNASRRRNPKKFSSSSVGTVSPEPVVELCEIDVECPDCYSVGSDCVCHSPISVAEADTPQLPWLCRPVHAAPYTRLPPSPVVPSVIPRSPRPENHHGQINHYRSEQVRRSLMRLEFKEPWAPDDLPVVRTPEEERERRRFLLEREESILEKRRWRWTLP
ncbi:hypothetical protein MSAN_00852200 [Mycena sanguinolenta]|uniref:Uncharacterized protein n=1 Tax=Mycena sanguinolenta TaxID=230812 RepID=A0A8H6YVJ1_9AGAR|nr:hypothetical protein MSAN_00852200 [Mycena sanguinolenta]